MLKQVSLLLCVKKQTGCKVLILFKKVHLTMYFFQRNGEEINMIGLNMSWMALLKLVRDNGGLAWKNNLNVISPFIGSKTKGVKCQAQI
jgi:hypothetical protein